MILREILDFFNINADLPEYLYEEEFNEVFLKGNLAENEKGYEITIKTRKDVTHIMIITPDDDCPLEISSLLPNGKTNGIRFGRNRGELKFI